MRFLFILAALPLVLAPARAAAGPDQCGAPEDVTVEAEIGEYCDIYARQMAYIEKRKKLRESLDERRENFAAPRRQAREKYKKDLDDYYGWGSPEAEDKEVMIEEGESQVFE